MLQKQIPIITNSTLCTIRPQPPLPQVKLVLKCTNKLLHQSLNVLKVYCNMCTFWYRINQCISYLIQSTHTFIHKVSYRCLTCGCIYTDE